MVGVKHARLGETVAAFLQLATPSEDSSSLHEKISTAAVQEWVREKLGRHKAPAHVFWLGSEEVPADVPLTGSGKVKKFEMAKLAEGLLRREGSKL